MLYLKSRSLDLAVGLIPGPVSKRILGIAKDRHFQV